MPPQWRLFSVGLLLCTALVPRLGADTLVIEASADTAMLEAVDKPVPGPTYEDDFNLGRERYYPAGTRGAFVKKARSRALMRFDIAGALPACSTIISAELTLTVVRTPTGASNGPFALHRVLADWGEGAGSGDDPGGRAAVAGEATWNASFHAQQTWSVPGGDIGVDFSSQAAATRAILGNGSYVFDFDPTGVGDLQSMLDDPGANFGWMLTSQSEGTAKTARQFASREDLTESRRPRLRIDFTPPPPPPVPEIIAFKIVGDGVRVRFSAAAGIAYELERSDVLEPASWEVVDSLPAVESEGELELVDSSLPPLSIRAFYRIRALRVCE